MENPLIQIKNAVIKVLKSIDPQVDVFFEKIQHTDKEHGFNIPDRYYFVDIVPTGNETVDRYFTDMGVLVDIAYHDKNESNDAYLIKSAELDMVIRPVFSFGDRHITIPGTSSKVTDHVLHCSFTISFRQAREVTKEFEEMGVLQMSDKQGG